MLDHLLNFVFPAVAVGLLVATLAPLVLTRTRPHHSWLAQGAINSVTCVAVLFSGLWFFGHDAKMATYTAMVVACASSQWISAKAWRG